MSQSAQGCEGVLANDGKPVLSEAEGTLRRSYDRAGGPVASASGQRVSRRAKAGAGAVGRGRQVQRNNRGAQTPGDAGPAGDEGYLGTMQPVRHPMTHLQFRDTGRRTCQGT